MSSEWETSVVVQYPTPDSGRQRPIHEYVSEILDSAGPLPMRKIVPRVRDVLRKEGRIASDWQIERSVRNAAYNGCLDIVDLPEDQRESWRELRAFKSRERIP